MEASSLVHHTLSKGIPVMLFLPFIHQTVNGLLLAATTGSFESLMPRTGILCQSRSQSILHALIRSHSRWMVGGWCLVLMTIPFRFMMFNSCLSYDAQTCTYALAHLVNMQQVTSHFSE